MPSKYNSELVLFVVVLGVVVVFCLCFCLFAVVVLRFPVLLRDRTGNKIYRVRLELRLGLEFRVKVSLILHALYVQPWM